MESPDDPKAAARAAGLRYTPDDIPGITRRRTGTGWSYRDPDGAVIRDPEQIERIRGIVIPPAWTEVWINPSPRGHIQATGRDARGRKQYRYHPQWRASRDETKFSRMVAFATALPGIRERVEADLGRPGLPREKTLAVVVRLLDESLIRVGNAEYARDNASYGLTTLRDKHVDVEGSMIHFTFPGKSGKVHDVDVRDRRVARLVKRLQDLPGQHLFQYLDDDGERQSVDSGDVNAYLHEIAGEGFTAKDFRTWAGTVLAARSLRDLGPFETESAMKSNIVAAVDAVAARLGNTRAVCRAAYIHPAVLLGYERGELSRFSCDDDASGLDPDERWALGFLRGLEAETDRQAAGGKR
ncbi:MAG: topA [Thermomicrobiales bacterium]|jgi:DNA topoisomerase-1|nr:topA [Thermomicrobiales bacterium]MDF3040364.1 topA [Thermomicrobiales bacterium]